MSTKITEPLTHMQELQSKLESILTQIDPYDFLNHTETLLDTITTIDKTNLTQLENLYIRLYPQIKSMNNKLKKLLTQTQNK